MDQQPLSTAVVKSEVKSEYSEEDAELPQTNIIEIERTNEENGEVQTVVLQNIQIEDSGEDQLAFIGKIISQTNSNGNFQINSLDENSVIRTYIINNTQYQEVETDDIYYEELEEDENSIEYVIEEAVEYEEAADENIEYTQLTTLRDEYELHDGIEEETVDDPGIQEFLDEEETQEEEQMEEENNKEIMKLNALQEGNTTEKDYNVDENNIKLEFLECDMCNKSFRTPAGLKRHITVNHEKRDEFEYDDPLTLKLCPCCGEPYDTAHQTGDYKCNFCDKLFTQSNFLKRHVSIEHPKDGKYPCIECKFDFVTKELLIDHLRFHPIKSVKCKECNKEFTRKYHLDRHIGQTGCMGQPRKVFECRVCKRCFTRRDNLAEHLRNHAGQSKKKKKFTCDYCHKEFQGVNLLNIHVRTHTGEKPYKCDLCPKSFPSTGAMKKHRRMHTGEKPYRCFECDRTFAAKETLNRHYRTHTGEKPHKCKFCGKSFIQPSQLRAHIFHHTGENAYTCQYCGRAFNRNLRLTTHIKFMHEGAEPLPCSKCDKTFFRKEDVARHMLSHSGERPFLCEVCNKGFAVKSSLKIHMNIHRKEQPCSCETCGRAFIRRDCLMRHIRARHRDVLEDILASAEKKRLQQQLLTAVSTSPMTITENIVWNELTLTESVKELLTLLVDEECLLEFGYPDAPVDRVLDSVIKRCGHTPASEEDFDYIGRIRENAKLLFTAVIDDDAVKELLNNQTVDEVILHVLRLAKKQQENK
ncbi:uncharacterized protein [Diabrotica undecimpunctata]|uniref:uncharacterized protein n=1 Tax=Diabrotica undecimpunctata TaxID=50387 RepID=UPI003B6410E1